MDLIVDNIKWIMIVAGVLTLTMLQAVFAPKAAMRQFFGETLEGPAGDIVVRTWGAMICLSAAFILYAAFNPEYRAPAMLISMGGKGLFAALVFSHRAKKAYFAGAFDAAIVLLYALYLLALYLTPVAATSAM